MSDGSQFAIVNLQSQSVHPQTGGFPDKVQKVWSGILLILGLRSDGCLYRIAHSAGAEQYIRKGTLGGRYCVDEGCSRSTIDSKWVEREPVENVPWPEAILHGMRHFYSLEC
jgi:hypothetical protein